MTNTTRSFTKAAKSSRSRSRRGKPTIPSRRNPAHFTDAVVAAYINEIAPRRRPHPSPSS